MSLAATWSRADRVGRWCVRVAFIATAAAVLVLLAVPWALFMWAFDGRRRPPGGEGPPPFP